MVKRGKQNSADIFKANKRESSVDCVINVIKEGLINGKLVPGDRLPSEIELSRRLALSRGTIREAMKILSAFGVVEIRQGDGTYISMSDEEVVFEPLLFSLILNKENMKELVELRELLERAIVKLILTNATEGDMQEIRKTVEEMERVIKSGGKDIFKKLLATDLGFHRALGRASKNRMVEKIYYFVMDFFAPSIEMTHRKQGKQLQALAHHKAIYKALSEKSLPDAIEAVKESIDVWKTLTFQKDQPYAGNSMAVFRE